VQGAIVESVTRRTYDQYCGLARALDVLGERWSLLVVRELLIGPKRFSDLMDGLPGIGANALSARLKSLEADGLIAKRRLPPPAASTVYELTERGRALEPMVLGLMRWGLELLGDPSPRDSYRPAWLVNGLRAAFEPEAARGVRRSYRLTVDDEVLDIRIDDGTIEVVPGPGAPVDVAMVTDSETLLGIGAGQLTADEAIAKGRVVIEEGDPGEALALAGLLRLPADAAV
jgi:DNA-binding HxlR family transcriptional regulator/putative sterol carrier protein